MKEEKLIKKLKNNDQKALEDIIRKYSGYVCTVARNFSNGALSETDIDEISIDVFYGLWKVRGRLDVSVGLSAYLSASVKNAVKNCFKSSPPISDDISELMIASEMSVENEAELGDMMKALDECVEQLSPDEQEIFTRFYIYGEKTSRIAQKLGKTEGAVQTGLSRMREKLRKMMTERGYDHV